MLEIFGYINLDKDKFQYDKSEFWYSKTGSKFIQSCSKANLCKA